jgi:hypothetical protein
MTDKQKAAFLKSEGWKRRKDSEFGDMIWVDPLGRWERMNTPSAYEVAHRRKSQRESRRLKAAGWVHCGSGCWAHWKRRGLWYRTQALKTLDGGAQEGRT